MRGNVSLAILHAKEMDAVHVDKGQGVQEVHAKDAIVISDKGDPSPPNQSGPSYKDILMKETKFLDKATAHTCTLCNI